MGTIPSVSDLGFSTPETARQPEPGALVIYTRFGGLFYLLNLGLFLGLYSDFASPGNQDISLSAWDLLAIAGWAWIGPDLQADPLWPLLGSLAGRQPDTPIGAGFEPPTSWKAPSRWMEPFTSQFCDSSTSDGRLRVRHPAGFLLLDIPFDPVISFQEQLDLALADYRSWLSGAPVAAAAFSYSPPEMHALESLGLSAPLRRWAAWLLNYSACRLNLALGLKDASTLPSFILAYSARIELTPVHLDITYSLADLPVEIRLAGLDRDPWWMPAAGRFISFHYE